MAYSIVPILHHRPDKNGTRKVLIQVIYKRMKAYGTTPVKVQSANFAAGVIIKLPNSRDINHIIQSSRNQIEKRLLDAISNNTELSKEELTEIVKGTKVDTSLLTDFIDFIKDKLKTKLSPGRLRHYEVMKGKVDELSPGMKLSAISVKWLDNFEIELRKKGLDINTINSNMNVLKTICRKAQKEGLIDLKQFDEYKVPKYEQKLVEYPTEAEIDRLLLLLQQMGDNAEKLSGYYYALSFFTGYRISDAKRFEYEKMVQDGMIILRAAKNKRIVSIPVFPKLQTVLDYIKDKPLYLSEEKVREYVKSLLRLIGVKKDISYHSSRHGFAMMLMTKEFTIDEVAELIGDSAVIAKVYARIHNPTLNKKIMERLK